MSTVSRAFLLLGVLLAIVFGAVSGAAAHAAIARSDPPVGAVLPEAPSAIRLWFTEPLESRFTRAQVLDAAGAPVAGAASAIAPADDHQLVVTLPADLPDGAYAVAWRTLSAADGHTMEGYFGFSVGAGGGAAVVPQGEAAQPGDAPRSLARGLALVGLAAVLAIPLVTLAALDPAARAVPSLAPALERNARRYAIAAGGFALLANVALLLAQAAAVAPDAALPSAVREILTETRFGSLWLARVGLLLACLAAIAVALRSSGRTRTAALVAGSAIAAATTLPVSLISHAAAQTDGRTVAIVSDALHLALAAVWGGGLFLLAAVLFPALGAAAAEERRVVLALAMPRFSAIGLTAWGVLVLTGLYAAWLQVGSLAAVRETPYGQSLLLKGALLLPILALAALHFRRGRGGFRGDALSIARTVGLEALLVVAVLLVAGHLIGQQPAREVLAARAPTTISVPLAFAAAEGERTATLTISPGAAGVNTFTIAVAGPPLAADAEGVLRFALPSQEIGARELRLPAVAANTFRAEGDQLVLPGEWRIEAIVREIGAFSWSTTIALPIEAVPPPAPAANPAPVFPPAAVVPVLVLTVGLAALAVAAAIGTLSPRRRTIAGVAGLAAVSLAGTSLAGLRLPPPEVVPAVAAPIVATPPVAATPGHDMAHHGRHHAGTPVAVTPDALPGPGTPVLSGDLRVTIEVAPAEAGPADVAVILADPDGAPVTGARVAVLSEMTAMAGHRDEAATLETRPGRYVARDVPLAMPGTWRLTVRVSPRGEPTTTARFTVDVE